MSQIAAAQITFGIAARAAGLSEKALRNWLDKGQVGLEFDRDREGASWRRFSILDVMRLAVIGALVRYGLRVQVAVSLVDTEMAAALRALATYRKTPPRAAAARFMNLRIAVSLGSARVDGDAINIRIARTPNEELDLQGMRHCLIVHVGAILDDVLTGLGH